MTPLFFVAAGLYGLATLFYFVYLFGRGDRALRLARWTLGGALLVHLAMIGLLCVRQLNPLRDLRGALSLAGWLVGTGFLLTTLRTRLGAVGAFVGPLCLALLISARLTPQTAPPGGDAIPVLGKLHIALSAFGVATFGLAAAMALIYLFQERALKNRRLGLLNRRSPPLNTLDEVGRKLILAGFPIYTLAMITGAIWVSRLPAHDGLRVEYVIAAATWLVFAGLIGARVTVGWRGNRAAVATIVGFLATVAVLALYMVRRLMGI